MFKAVVSPPLRGETRTTEAAADLSAVSEPLVIIPPGHTPARAGRWYLPQLTPALTTAAILKALRYRWLLASTVGISLFAAFAITMWLCLPAKYTAYALLRVASTEPQLMPDGRSPAIEQERYFENTQVTLIRSRPILLAALQRPGIGNLKMIRDHPDAASWLGEEELKVGYVDQKTEILRIGLEGTDPREAAMVVNAIKDAYLDDAVNARRREKLAERDNLEKIYIASEQKARAQREALRELAESLQSGDTQALSIKQKAILEEYAALKRELYLVQAQLRGADVAQSVKGGAPGADSVPVPAFLVERELDLDVIIAQKKSELAHINTKISQYEKLTTSGQPALVRAEQERDAITKELERLRAERRAAVTAQIREKTREEMRTKSETAKENIEVLRRQQAELKKEVDRVGKEAQKFGITSFELELKRNEIEQSEAVVKKLRERKEQLEVELQSTKQRVTELYAAEEPQKSNLMARARLSGFAGFAGLFIGLLGVGSWEARTRRILGKHEVAHELGLRVVGVLPRVDGQDSKRRARVIDPSLLLREAADGIRAQLLGDPEEHCTGRLLMVTSAVPQEGKTTLACHLALSIARAERKTLLIDCDLRRPALHHVFDMPCGPGLSEVLRGEAELAEVIRPGSVEWLGILPAGENSRQAIPMLATGEMRSLLDQLRKSYDFVLIDCSPVLLVADALMLGKRVDGALLSIRPELSQMTRVQEAYEQLSSAGIFMLGTVVNGIRPDSNLYHYGYGYYADVSQ